MIESKYAVTSFSYPMKIDCVRFFVTDGNLFASWLIDVLGFELVWGNQEFPWIGELSEGNHPSQHTYILQSGSVRLIVSSPQQPSDDAVRYLQTHPPGVGEISFLVDNIEEAIARLDQNQIQILTPLQELKLEHQQIRWLTIAGWSSLTHISHVLVERRWLTENLPCNHSPSPLEIDHIVINVPDGELIPVSNWYKNILGFQPQQSFNIQTETSGLCSQVMMSPCGRVQIPINQPTTANSQIQEFINANNGAGIQHIALRLPNIIDAITQLRQRGLQFLSVPPSYYTNVCQRHGFPLTTAELQAIASQQILVDWHQNTPFSPLLQIFTQPIFAEPTFFFEFIERRQQAKGFGEGNFRALFTAIESEQDKRGTLRS
ncbi:4-hydroxyphenylpyruvate dioxygenase [Calothrix sp. NIES-3974]|nr:4-hydroxyphenylpyruvate dioxygenase [Calothrix sp. NIES-3974]